MDLHALSFYYQYAVGGVVFLITLGLVMASGELSLKDSEGRRYFGILVGGFLLYVVLHGLSIFVLPHT
ncbi:MAG: hypothetical protein JXQ73_21780 [Phycisphaerae bacterium]|nr:hypothetical protein [Phycisphaerae bacterium]